MKFTIQCWNPSDQKWEFVASVSREDADRFMEQSNRLQNRYRIKEDA